MRSKLSRLALSVLSLLLLLSAISLPASFAPATARASEVLVVKESDKNKHIFDEAGLLSTEQAEALEAMCIKYGEKENFQIIIITHSNPNAKDGEIYLEDFYDQMVYGDSVLLLIDMYNRDVIIQGYGKAEYNINSNRGDSIRDEITPYLSDGEYEIAFQKYIKKSAEYMKYDSEFARIFSNVYLQIILSLVIAGIVVAIMVYNSSGQMTTGGNTYLDQGHSGLIGRRDQYIKTTVTKVRKPSQSSSSGSHKGGVSSGGHSHSSSRGKF